MSFLCVQIRDSVSNALLKKKIVVLQHCDSDVEDVNIHSEGLAMLLSWFRSTQRPRVAVSGNGTKLSLLPCLLCDESSAL